jgi:choline transport protein
MLLVGKFSLSQIKHADKIGVIALALGAIPLGSKTAFLDLAGSFIILTTVSYAIPIAAHLFNGRKTVKPGYFWMGKAGFIIQPLALFFIIFFDTFFCFRKS